MVKKYSQAFTLIELIIVVTLLAFLIVLGMSYFRSQTFKANDARRKSDIHNIQVAVEEYEKDNNCYPLPDKVTCNPGLGLRPYLNKVPCDPVTNASYYYSHEDSICPKWYKVYTNLDYDNDKDITINIGPNDAYNYTLGSYNAPTSVSGASATNTPSPTAGGGGQQSQGDSTFYGCIASACVPINWDSGRPGPECDPSYQNSTCYGQCVNISNECEPWQ